MLRQIERLLELITDAVVWIKETSAVTVDWFSCLPVRRGLNEMWKCDV